MPEIIVLGSAQDGGLPHAGCLCRNCQSARSVWRLRRLPVSLGVISGDNALLVDATSAFAEQVHRLWTCLPASDRHRAERYPAPQQVMLTHAHTGHYVGLWQLDRSVMAARAVQVFGPPQTIALLKDNEPWKQMSREGFIEVAPIPLDMAFEPFAGVRITPISVPHRSEWNADTVGLRIEGPQSTVLFIPDIDSWEAWDRDIVEMVRSVDVALLDGCFWAAPHRPGVPHPSMQETMDRLQPLIDTGESDVAFIHVNHSNPALTPDSIEAQEIGRRGYRVAGEGETHRI